MNGKVINALIFLVMFVIIGILAVPTYIYYFNDKGIYYLIGILIFGYIETIIIMINSKECIFTISKNF